jgi:hypothetical protein
VSLHWQDPRTDANKQEPPKELANVNSMTSCELS